MNIPLALLAAVLPVAVFAAAPAPFGATAKAPAKTAPRPAKVVPTEVGFLGANRSRWNVELPAEGHPNPFEIVGEGDAAELRLRPAELKPAYTTVRMLLPGDGPANGNVWAKNQCNYVAFECRSSSADVSMTFHLLQRGKTAGTYRAGFTARPGEWRRVVLPVGEFGLRNFANIAGVGVRVADGASPPAVETVALRALRIGGAPYADAAWTSHSLRISLAGDWRFREDPNGWGVERGWQAADFDDSGWDALAAGKTWESQGRTHAGWGWYRQTLHIPDGCEGMPLTLFLGNSASDDDVWFNGVRVGGIHGEYKYRDRLQRAYAIPAALVRPGDNAVAVRCWGGNLSFIGAKSGLASGTLQAEFDPYATLFRSGSGASAVPYRLFDLTEAQRGLPFEIVFPFPADLVTDGGAKHLRWRVADLRGNAIAEDVSSLAPHGDGVVAGVAAIGAEESRVIYLRGRVQATLSLENAENEPVYLGTRTLDGLSFAARDDNPLPPLRDAKGGGDDTPYGSLRLVDEIDCSTPFWRDSHPYLESGVDHDSAHHSPGIPADVRVRDILGRSAREAADRSWFAYRIGRGALKPHATYLLRVEYPEDEPRFAAMEIQTGQNYMDVGLRTGVSPDDVYDPWPLSREWRWYDVVFPLDDETVGTGGTGAASAQNGVWVYFMNKKSPNLYYALWDGGPAVARIRLYEIDPAANAPAIRYPEELPRRTLALDWERQADHEPTDLVAYARLMGYNAVSPIMLKWSFANYADPVDGYETVAIDPQNYWTRRDCDADGRAVSPWPSRPSQHRRYLDATRAVSMGYLPRVEWGGSELLPEEARSIETTGETAKPNRFAQWGANLLNPVSFEDFRRYLDALVGPFAEGNPQLLGVLWRVRCDRVRISYGEDDLRQFAEETGTILPPGGIRQRAAWASTSGREAYDAWWHSRRARFHAAIAAALRRHRPDLGLYVFNWDSDKFSLIQLNTTAWGFNKTLLNPGPGGARGVYLREEAARRALTAADYIETLRTGNLGEANYNVNRADQGIRPDLYRDIPGVHLFAPVNALC